MKTQIKYSGTVLQEVPLPPEQIVPLLVVHFQMKWGQLQRKGIWLAVDGKPAKLAPPPTPKTPEQLIEECSEEDGTVWGVRYFNAHPPGFLISPSSAYVWESATQEVERFSNAEAVRGHHGFHAAWAEDLTTWGKSKVDHHTTICKALVKGFGDVIVGEMGWRSSKMTIVQAKLKYDTLLAKLQARYPDVAFSVGSDDEKDDVQFTFSRRFSGLRAAAVEAYA